MAIVLQDKKISAEFIAIYQEMLADIPDDILVQAMKGCLLTCRFFPSIAEIREKAQPFLEKLRIEQIKEPDADWCKKQAYRKELEIFCHAEADCLFANSGKCLKYVVTN
jgi:hypothetical protein